MFHMKLYYTDGFMITDTMPKLLTSCQIKIDRNQQCFQMMLYIYFGLAK